MSTKIDLVGQRFGFLVVLSDAETRKGKQCVWRCKCDCGETLDVVGYNLRSGITKSCGCYRRRNGTPDAFGTRSWASNKLVVGAHNSARDGHAHPSGTPEEVQALWVSAKGVCPITSRPFDLGPTRGPRTPALDHCHATGALRGFVSRAANTGMGCFGDTVEGLDSAARYLAYHEAGEFIRSRCAG